MSNSRNDFEILLETIESSEIITSKKAKEIFARIDHLAINTDEKRQLYLAAAQKNPTLTRLIPGEMCDHNFWLEILPKWPDLKRLAPRTELQEYDIQLAIIARNGKELEHVPKHLYTKEICVIAIRNHPFAIKHVPEIYIEDDEFKDALSVIYEAIQKNGDALDWLPKSKRTLDICLKAVRENYEAVIYVPEEFIKNPEIEEAVRKWQKDILKHPDLIEDTPEYLLNKKICTAAFINNPDYMKYIPKKYRTYNLLLSGIEKQIHFSEILPFLSDYKEKTALTENEYHQIIIELINKYGAYLLIKIATEKMIFDICLMLAYQDGDKAIRFINDNKLKLADERLQQIYFSALSQDGLLLKDIPDKFRTEEMCSCAIFQNGLALEFVPYKQRNLNACIVAVKNKGKALAYVPADLVGNEIYISAVKEDGLALKYIPFDKRNKVICLTAVEENGYALEYVPNVLRNKKICLSAVSRDIESIRFVPEKIRGYIIDRLVPEELIRANYAIREFLPKDKKYNLLINKILSGTNNIIITSEDDFNTDIEIYDSCKVYCNSPERLTNTIHAHTEILSMLISDIEKNRHTNASLNLVLLGHVETNSSDLCGLGIDQITELLARHPVINRITLFGCRTVRASPLKKEINMINDYKKHLSLFSNLYSAIIIAATPPDPAQYPKLFERLKTDKHGNTSNTIFILIKNHSFSSTPASLLEIKHDNENPGNFIEHRYELNQNSISKIATLIGNNQGKIPAASKNKPIIYYRGGKTSVFLDPDESLKLIDIAKSGGIPRFRKDHPGYKEDKKFFPFLTNIEADSNDYQNISSSLFKKLCEAIKNEPEINHEIVIKGYTEFLHVDTEEKQFKIADTTLYKSLYTDRHNAGFFETNRSNIDQKKLIRSRKKAVEKMKCNQLDESLAKSITITIKK